MPEHGQIRITAAVRDNLDIDLLTQFVVMLGRQLSQETQCDGITAGGPPPTDPEKPT
jgi:hypothetical protein